MRRDFSDLSSLVRDIREFTSEFDRQAAIVMLIGLVIVAWDILVPVVGSRVIDAMVNQRPFEEVALVILALAALIWVPHGNVLPYLLELYDLRHLRVRLNGKIAVRCLRMALLNPENVRRVDHDPTARGAAQPVLVEARENIGKLMTRVVRELPLAMRGVCVLVFLVWMVPTFVPFLLLGALIDLGITYRMGIRLERHYQARQDAENTQRRLENELLASHFGEVRSSAEVDAALVPFRRAVEERMAREIAAETPYFGYKLQRDLVFNVTNVTSWLMGAWYVIVGGNPIGTFLFFIAWSSRAGDLFVVVMSIQQELMRSRRSFRQLASVVGLKERPDTVATAPPEGWEASTIAAGLAAVALPAVVLPAAMALPTMVAIPSTTGAQVSTVAAARHESPPTPGRGRDGAATSGRPVT